jgi:hypothetical protein
MKRWRIQTQSKNPLGKERIPKALGYQRWFEVEEVYLPLQGSTKSLRVYKKRIHNTMAIIVKAGSATPVMRVAWRWPQVDWKTGWENLRDTPVLETTRVAWYRVVHDIIPTKERLHRINKSPAEACRHCGKTDTIGHRLTDCGDGSRIWNWTKRRIATML